METDEPIRRTSEIEEITNLYFIHPIASRLTLLFAKLRLTPNGVSLIGMLCGLLAGVAYYRYQEPQYTVAGFGLMIAWHVMDGADGQLARLTHSQSRFGKVLDGICDNVTFIAVYTALAMALSRKTGGWVWALVITAGLCHAIQSGVYEFQRQEYNFWGWGDRSAETEGPKAPRNGGGMSPTQRLLDLLYRLYMRVQFRVAGVAFAPSHPLGWLYIRLQFRMAGVTAKFRERLVAILERDPEHAAFVRRRYREAFAPSLRRWSVLSSNYRTLGIFISALVKAPQYYFWFEIIGFSIILIVLMSTQRARYELFFNSLGMAG